MARKEHRRARGGIADGDYDDHEGGKAPMAKRKHGGKVHGKEPKSRPDRRGRALGGAAPGLPAQAQGAPGGMPALPAQASPAAQARLAALKKGGHVKRARGGSVKEPLSGAGNMSKLPFEAKQAPADEHGEGADKAGKK